MRNEKIVEGRNENFQLLGKRPRNKSAAHTICPVHLPGAYPLRSPGRNPRLWTALQYLLGRSHNRWMRTQKPARKVICPRITLASVTVSWDDLDVSPLPVCTWLCFWIVLTSLSSCLMKISTGSITCPQTQHCQTQLISPPNYSS